MSIGGTGEYRSGPVEQHLGDRLAAFVDGELTGDSRDRVLAHLATCPQCKTAAAEQRRLKSAVAGSEPPTISAGLLARLQGLPDMGDLSDLARSREPGAGSRPPGSTTHPTTPADGEGRRGPWGHPRVTTGAGGLLASGRVTGSGAGSGAASGPDAGLSGFTGLFAARSGEEFSYLSPAPDLVDGTDLTAAGLVGSGAGGGRSRGGFRVHEPSRGRRFAFAAAGAVSLAAIAIGGALPMEAAVDNGARPDDGPAVTPFSANTVSDTRGVVPRGVLDRTEERHPLRPRPTASATSTRAASASAVSLPITVAPGGNSFVLH